MEVTVKELEGCRRMLEITVPSEEPDKAYQDMLNEFRRSLQVPGFRKGKVPASVIEQRFGKELTHEVIEKLVPKALGEAIEKEGLRPVEQPVRDDVQYTQGQPLKIVASFEVQPKVELEAYTGLEIKIDPKEYKVAKKDVDEQLEQLQERSATFETVELVRPVQDDDYVVLDLRGEPAGDNAVPWKREDITLAITDPKEDGGFSKNLIGIQTGGKKEFTVEYPKDFDDEVLAGTKVKYEVEVKQIKKKILPALDDEFAKDLGQFENLDALREEVEKQLEAEKQRQRRNDIERGLIDIMIEKNPEFDLPQVMVQRELARIENELRRDMMNRGINPDHMGFDWNEFKNNAREQAEWNVRRILLLDNVADKEKVEVTTKDIRAEIDAIAASYQQDPKELRRQMLEDGRFEAIGEHLRDHKSMEWLVENNKIKEGKK